MKAATWKNLPIEECVNVHLEPRGSFIGSQPTAKYTHFWGSVGAGQVISIIREEGEPYIW